MKNAFFYFSLFFISISQLTFSQNKIELTYPILKTNELNKGIYKDLKEFLSNSPSYDCNFNIIERGEFAMWFGARPTVLKYSPDSSNKMKRYLSSHWGVCDGKDIYIKYAGRYLKLDLTGKYCKFLNYGYRSQAIGAPGTGSSSVYFEQPMVVNIHTGQKYIVNKSGLKQLLATEDQTLLEEFKLEKQKNRKLNSYIDLLNEKYSF